ncbi:NAD(P)-dependent oxidoreductase [Cupriavidus sp. IDO]|uniref:NAD(P)-dependent oxidoreductase n=1 Tax=Cupriavidus sp. IDO TaxID=1539142 RepID=UPI00057926A1|nr:NAD(P)-dependent oxidoreductase [Cupriavidus sp. IDO]KWR87218.1 hydroxyacid dehydrogenase [Cupriavidus sp. IDO]
MSSDTREPVLRIGVFEAAQQDAIDAEFRCVSEAEIAADGALRGAVRAIVTRSNYQVPAAVIDRLPALRVIATSGVGYDGIPVAHAARRGIVVTNTPGVLDAAVCELGIGLLLALLRRIPAADRHVRGGAWREDDFPLTTSLAGKRIGIVGLGRIGMGVAQRLAPFGVELAYTGTQRASLPYRYCDSPLALAASVDILILTCRATEQNRHLVDAALLAALGPDGYLLNLARGSVVDEAALCEALRAGTIRGAALDVFESEPLADSPLTALPNVLLSPHAGTATRETRAVMLRLMLDNAQAVLAGRAALTPVAVA